MSSKRVLVVEDDLDSQQVVQFLLEHHQMQVDVTETGEHALVMVQQQPTYDAAIIDLELPGIDGFTLMNRLKNNSETSELPCIAVTAYHSADLAVKAIEAGFTGYFSKPVDTLTFAQEFSRIVPDTSK